MTGAKAAMEGVHEALREPLDGQQVAALVGLADRVRELTEALIHTDIPGDEIAAVSDEVAALTARLSAARRARPPFGRLEPDGAPHALGSPVTGQINPLAPPIRVKTHPDGTVRAEYTLSAVYEGPPTFVHGGISALVLDHLVGHAAAVNGTPGMTATLELRYRRPTPYGVPLVAEAKATRSEGRRTWADGRILDPEGRTTVEATAMLVMPRS